jgi:hypothetical protein
MKEFNNLEAYYPNITIIGTKSRMARLATRVARMGVYEYIQNISRKILEKKYTYMDTQS